MSSAGFIEWVRKNAICFWAQIDYRDSEEGGSSVVELLPPMQNSTGSLPAVLKRGNWNQFFLNIWLDLPVVHNRTAGLC